VFDASIDLGGSHMPAGLDRAEAVAAVRAAVQALPGAGWIDVAFYPPGIAVQGPWVRLFRPGGGGGPAGADGDALRGVVEGVALAAIAGLAPRAAPEAPATPASVVAGAWPVAPYLIGGFAEQGNFRVIEPAPAPQSSVSRQQLPSLTGEDPGDGRPALQLRRAIAAGQADGLGDADLLAALLSMVLPVEPAPLAARLVARFGSFAALLSASVAELQAVPGLGSHSVAAIKLVHAAALRAGQARLMHREVLHDMDSLIAYLTAVLARERIEQFRVLFLDADDRLIADEAQARGTVNHTPVYPREVVRRAIALKATAMVLVHNHPSGDPTPSQEDIDMTAQICNAAELLGLDVQDHLVVGNGRWVSLRAEGLM